MVRLKLTPADDAQNIRVQETEIAEARWIPLSEVADMPYYEKGGNLHEMVLASAMDERAGFSLLKLSSSVRKSTPPSCIYRSRL